MKAKRCVCVCVCVCVCFIILCLPRLVEQGLQMFSVQGQRVTSFCSVGTKDCFTMTQLSCGCRKGAEIINNNNNKMVRQCVFQDNVVRGGSRPVWAHGPWSVPGRAHQNKDGGPPLVMFFILLYFFTFRLESCSMWVHP